MVNIFFTNIDPKIAAQESCDQYVVKIPIEIGLLLSAIHWREFSYDGPTGSGEELRYEGDVVKPARGPYSNSKVVKSGSVLYQWLIKSRGNYQWAINYGLELISEYELRYGKNPKTLGVLLWLLREVPDLPDLGLTMDVGLSMPEKYRVIGDPVRSYQQYIVGEKSGVLRWRFGLPPEWYTELLGEKNLRENNVQER